MNTRDLDSLMDTHGRYFFSPKEVVGFRNEEQGRTHRKPWGLWYSCSDAWFHWVMEKYPEWTRSWAYLYKVVVTDEILVLPTASDVQRFNALYRFKASYTEFINWAAVAKDFPGIEICPHQPSLHTAWDWYYSWDVASGCIWNERGLDYILPLAQRVEKTDEWLVDL